MRHRILASILTGINRRIIVRKDIDLVYVVDLILRHNSLSTVAIIDQMLANNHRKWSLPVSSRIIRITEGNVVDRKVVIASIAQI